MAEGDSSDPQELACPDCGSELNPTDVYCSSCGTQVRITADDVETDEADDGTTSGSGDGDDGSGEGSGTGDDQFGETKTEFRRRVQSMLADGWDVAHDAEDSVVLVDRSLGNPGIHLLLFPFTGGFGNAVYAWYKYHSDANRIVLRRGDDTTAGSKTAPAPEEYEDDSPSTEGLLGGLAVLLFGLLIAISQPTDPATLLMGLFLMTVGAYILPQVRRRLADRYPLATFGRTKTTEERYVQNPDVPCTVCMSPVEEGVKRTYTEEQVFAGVPLFTMESGVNQYCRKCAATGVSPASVTDTASSELAGLLDDEGAGDDAEQTGGKAKRPATGEAEADLETETT